MTGRSHLIVGACAFALAYASMPAVSGSGSLVMMGAATLFGSLLPDIDSPDSMLGRYVHIPVEHRTVTHAIWIPLILFGLSILWWGSFWGFVAFGLSLGWFSHIAVDGVSTAGVAYLWPMTDYIRYSSGAFCAKGHTHWKLYHTGEPSETMVVAAIVVLTVLGVLILGQLPHGDIDPVPVVL